jgi:uncharacterized protein (TIGR02118 family)
MIKRMAMIGRRAGESFEQFSSYWLNHHGDLVLRSPGVARYQQNHVVEPLLAKNGPGNPIDFDGVVELWFESQENMDLCFSSEAGSQLPEDEERFLDMMTRHQVADAPQPASRYKLMVAVTEKDDGGALAALRQELDASLRQSAVLNTVDAVFDRKPLRMDAPGATAFLQYPLGDDAVGARVKLGDECIALLARHASEFERMGAYLVEEKRVV